MGSVTPGTSNLFGRPSGHAQAPQPNETLGVLMPERIRSVVGGQTVIVEPDRAPAPDHKTLAGFEMKPYLAGDVAL
jgi:hypothetical protein